MHFDVASLPYAPELIEYLEIEKKKGTTIKLVTLAPRAYAERISAHLGLFDGIISLESTADPKGRRRLALIRDEIGDANFVYAGTSPAESYIWASADERILVNPPKNSVTRTSHDRKTAILLSSGVSRSQAFLKEARLHQWAKNLLVLVPIFTSHLYGDLFAIGTALIAFLAFSLCASGVYMLNDLFDLDADRRHPIKRSRPLASGELPLSAGILGAFSLPIFSLFLAWLMLPPVFLAVLLAYYSLTIAYSVVLKRLSTADVMTLAVLYAFRIVAGAVAVDVALPSWLVAFSVFAFVSLAYLKRYIELSHLVLENDEIRRRGYKPADREAMFSLGVANITASVVVLALYISSSEVAELYENPTLLWIQCLLMLYWGNRIWIGARRGKIPDDPVVFALRDYVSLMVLSVSVLVTIAAKYISL